VCVEDLVVPGVVFEFKDRYIPIGARACQEAARFVRRPGDYIYGCCVEGKIEDAGPGVALFAPYEDFAVVRGGCEDVTEFRMCPGDGPDCSFVSIAGDD
jgi:hypothetical protein